MRAIAWLWILLFTASAAEAATDVRQICSDETLKALSNQPGHNNQQALASACKSAPDDTQKMLSAIAYRGQTADAIDFNVVLLDKSSNQILSRFSEVMNQEGDFKVRPHGLKLDTARYVLAKGVRAFGVRDDFTVCGSAADSCAGDSLSLYIVKATKITRVLNRLAMHYNTNPDLTDKFYQSSLTLSVSRKTSNGLANLLAKEIPVTIGKGFLRAARKYILQFDGTSYPTYEAPQNKWSLVPLATNRVIKELH